MSWLVSDGDHRRRANPVQDDDVGQVHVNGERTRRRLRRRSHMPPHAERLTEPTTAGPTGEMAATSVPRLDLEPQGTLRPTTGPRSGRRRGGRRARGRDGEMSRGRRPVLASNASPQRGDESSRGPSEIGDLGLPEPGAPRGRVARRCVLPRECRQAGGEGLVSHRLQSSRTGEGDGTCSRRSLVSPPRP